MLEAGVLFLLGWLIGGGAYGKKKKPGGGIAPEPAPPRPPGPAPTTPREVPWPKEPTKAERDAAAMHQAMAEPGPGMTKPDFVQRARHAAQKEAYGPSPLSDVSEYRKATRPGGRVVAPDLPKSDWREPPEPGPRDRDAEAMRQAMESPGKG